MANMKIQREVNIGRGDNGRGEEPRDWRCRMYLRASEPKVVEFFRTCQASRDNEANNSFRTNLF